ncbi:hypothetical protein NM208_g1265 [Fusarium decemcellulare]|uniref:Uncharacterized protein n=1 Tax=Fusarium decemcellulare TaxID=57161 RepID=A0ACC1SWG3_9HYPO|nr:hypothetical protein NM208_g1265 [Fusarium decemcellulare]
MATVPTESRQWHLFHYPDRYPELSGPNPTFKLVTVPLSPLEEGEVLIKTLYISNDAAQRVWIVAPESRPRAYVPPVEIGDVMRARSLGKVIDTRSSRLPSGSLVLVPGGWSEYVVALDDKCTIVPTDSGFNASQYLGALGVTGLTSYYGLVEIAKATSEDVVVVSGAAGATGNIVVQVAKHLLGCKKVFGIAGTDEKCDYVRSLGADDCFNYKSTNFQDDMARKLGTEVDVFFGFMFTRMKQGGRIALCGAISRYNTIAEKVSFKYFDNVITQRLSLDGFVVLDYLDNLPKVIKLFTKAAKEGKLQIGGRNETQSVAKFEEIPKVWLSLYEGANHGKLITKLVE